MEDLPDDAGVEDAMDRLYLLYKVERGLLQADRGELSAKKTFGSAWRNGSNKVDATGGR